MARKPREQSATGIYHAMLRGINKNNIFFSDDDFVKMQYILQDAQYVKNGQGKVLSDDRCTIYAYCLLDNHIHVLVKEGSDDISTIMKKIADRYAIYYNFKNERVGHLFQGRFPSEPVNDGEYFHTLLRYIHRNSVKAMEAHTPEEYPYSSWNEYVNHKSNVVKVLKTKALAAVIEHYPLRELKEWVNMDVDDNCLDMDNFKNVITDRDAKEILADVSGIGNPEDFKSLDPQTQIHYLLMAVDDGISLRQASRLSTVTYFQLQKAYKKKNEPIEPIADGNYVQKLHETISHIEGLGKQTRSRLHLIVEYLEQHPNSKNADIASYLNLNPENTRRLIVRLLNENILNKTGTFKSAIYALRSVE